jgi:hypothetical protein
MIVKTLGHYRALEKPGGLGAPYKPEDTGFCRFASLRSLPRRDICPDSAGKRIMRRERKCN